LLNGQLAVAARTNDRDIIVVFSARDVMPVEGCWVRLSAGYAGRVLCAESAQLLLLSILVIRTFSHGDPPQELEVMS
jgi:hypothetical protein